MLTRWTIERLPKRETWDSFGRPTGKMRIAWRVTYWVDGVLEDAFEYGSKRRAKRFQHYLCGRHGYALTPCVRV